MKNIVMLSAILAVVSVPAAAVQKCVALGSGTTCAATGKHSRPPTGKADRALPFTPSGTPVTVEMGTTSSPVDSLTTSTCLTGQCPAEGNAKYCYCRMVSPALSQWVGLQMGFASESTCLQNCASTCHQYLIDDRAVRTALFSTSTLSD